MPATTPPPMSTVASTPIPTAAIPSSARRTHAKILLLAYFFLKTDFFEEDLVEDLVEDLGDLGDIERLSTRFPPCFVFWKFQCHYTAIFGSRVRRFK
jgi:hypothetical protein